MGSARHEVQHVLTTEYDDMKERLIAALLSIGARYHDAEEQAHAALVETYHSADRLADVATAFSYSRTIAVRGHWRASRQRQRASPLALQHHLAEIEGGAATTVRTPEAVVDRHALTERLAAAFARLPQRERDMLWERHVEGDSCADIAERHALAPSSVPTLLHRARQRLRALLGHRDADRRPPA